MNDDPGNDKPDDPEEVASDAARPEPDNSCLVAQCRGAMQRLTGRQYRVALEMLDGRSLMELIRFVRDAEDGRDAAVRRARTNPWGMP